MEKVIPSMVACNDSWQAVLLLPEERLLLQQDASVLQLQQLPVVSGEDKQPEAGIVDQLATLLDKQEPLGPLEGKATVCLCSGHL